MNGYRIQVNILGRPCAAGVVRDMRQIRNEKTIAEGLGAFEANALTAGAGRAQDGSIVHAEIYLIVDRSSEAGGFGVVSRDILNESLCGIAVLFQLRCQKWNSQSIILEYLTSVKDNLL